jgi:hypothetical protein
MEFAREVMQILFGRPCIQSKLLMISCSSSGASVVGPQEHCGLWLIAIKTAKMAMPIRARIQIAHLSQDVIAAAYLVTLSLHLGPLLALECVTRPNQ